MQFPFEIAANVASFMLLAPYVKSIDGSDVFAFFEFYNFIFCYALVGLFICI